MERTKQNNKGSPFWGIARSIGINAILPLIIYNTLKNYTVLSELYVIALTGVPSLLDSIIGIIRNRRIDVVAGFVLISIVLSLAFIVLGGDPKTYLVRNSLILGVFGLLILLTSFLPRSLMYYGIRQATTGGSNEGMAHFDEQWLRDPSVRPAVHALSLIWGFGMLIETAASITLVLILSVPLFLLISPFVQLGLYGLLILLSIFIVKKIP